MTIVKNSKFDFRIDGYAQGKGTTVVVKVTAHLRQSWADNDVWVEGKVNDTLIEYSGLPMSMGLFGHFPPGHEKN